MGGGGFGIFPPDSGPRLHAVEDSKRGPNDLDAAFALRTKKVAIYDEVEEKKSKRVTLKSQSKKSFEWLSHDSDREMDLT